MHVKLQKSLNLDLGPFFCLFLAQQTPTMCTYSIAPLWLLRDIFCRLTVSDVKALDEQVLGKKIYEKSLLIRHCKQMLGQQLPYVKVNYASLYPTIL